MKMTSTILQESIETQLTAILIFDNTIPWNVAIIIHNRWNYDFHLVLKHLAKVFAERGFKYWGENEEKCINLSV